MFRNSLASLAAGGVDGAREEKQVGFQKNHSTGTRQGRREDLPIVLMLFRKNMQF